MHAFSKYLIFWICFEMLLNVASNFGTCQTVQAVLDQVEQKLEVASGTNDDTPDLSELDEQFRHLLEHPLNLNKCDEEGFRESGLFDEGMIKALINHKFRFGPFLTFYELQVVPGMNQEYIRSILPFVTVDGSVDDPNATFGRMLREGAQEVIVRTQLIPETKAGFITYYGPPAYEGSPVGLFVRYRFRFMKKLMWGVTMEKDPGESLFRGHQKNGFDFYSYHLAARHIGIFRMIALGDYQIDFGQGLTLSTGMSGGKPSDPLQYRRNAAGIIPYSSVNEISFRRGAAFSLGRKKWGLDLFGSYRKLDGNVIGSDDSIPGNECITYLQETGYHRTYGEFMDQHTVKEKMGGCHLGYRGKQFQAGFTGYFVDLSLPLNKNKYNYNQFEFRGSQTMNMGIDYGWLFRNLNFFGEVAQSRNGSVAFLHGVVAGIDPRLAVSFVYRNYPRNYQNLYSNAIRESGNNFNESGLLSGLSFRPVRTLLLQCSYDWFAYPWMRYDVDGPSNGTEFSGTLTWTPSRKTSLYVRIRETSKQYNGSESGHHITTLTNQVQQGIRFHLSSQVSKSLTLRTRVEFTRFNHDGANESGMIVFQDLLYHPMGRKLSGSIRYGIFDTDSYDSRVYAYENDVLGGYSIPAYYYRGTRINFNMRYKLADGVDFWFRYSASFYDNRDAVGSGLDEIEGSKKSEFKWQIRLEF